MSAGARTWTEAKSVIPAGRQARAESRPVTGSRHGTGTEAEPATDAGSAARPRANTRAMPGRETRAGNGPGPGPGRHTRAEAENGPGTPAGTSRDTRAEAGIGSGSRVGAGRRGAHTMGAGRYAVQPGGSLRGTLLVIAKAPVPGRVKTRLTPVYSPEEAARLAEAALVDTLGVVLATPARRRVLVLDGVPGAWLPAGIEVVPQCAGGLDARLAHAFGLCEGPALLIGMDTPQVTVELLTAGLELAPGHASFGPADDGGFWALGLATPDPSLLRGVPMSAPGTGAVQRGRLTGAGLVVRDLPLLRDVDTAQDAHAVAAAAPRTRFATTLTTLDRADRARSR